MRFVLAAVLVAGCGSPHAASPDAAVAVAKPPPDAAPTPDGPISPGHKQARKLNFDGDRLEQEGKLPEAIASYQQAVAIEPGYTQAWANLGYAQFEAKDLDSAKISDLRSLELATAAKDRDLIGAGEYNLGRIAQAQNDLAGARAHYRASLTARPHRGVASRLDKLDTSDQRREDAELLKLAEDVPIATPAQVLDDGSMEAALIELGGHPLGDETKRVALVLTPAGLTIVAHLGGRRYGTVLLPAQPRPKRVDVGQVEWDHAPPQQDWIIESDVGAWVVTVRPEGVRVILTIPRGYWFSLVGTVSSTDVKIFRNGATADPDGPQGTWRMVDGVYRKLEL